MSAVRCSQGEIVFLVSFKHVEKAHGKARMQWSNFMDGIYIFPGELDTESFWHSFDVVNSIHANYGEDVRALVEEVCQCLFQC